MSRLNVHPVSTVTMWRCLVSSAIMIFAAHSAQAQVTLQSIVENVRQNERLYENIEVTMTTLYEIGDRPVSDKNEIVRRETQTRFVSQGDWFRMERGGRGQTVNSTSSRDRICAYDGEKSRILQQQAVGNISSERMGDEDFVRPHVLILRDFRIAVPLSVYLS